MHEVTFLTREGCPGSPEMYGNLVAALVDVGIGVAPRTIDIGDLAEDSLWTGYGTPTVLIDGTDLFGRSTPRPAAPM